MNFIWFNNFVEWGRNIIIERWHQVEKLAPIIVDKFLNIINKISEQISK